MKTTSEAAFETVVTDGLLDTGYQSLPADGFDRERAIFPEVVLDFIRKTQAKNWKKLEALHGSKTDERVLHDMASSATARHSGLPSSRPLMT